MSGATGYSRLMHRRVSRQVSLVTTDPPLIPNCALASNWRLAQLAVDVLLS